MLEGGHAGHIFLLHGEVIDAIESDYKGERRRWVVAVGHCRRGSDAGAAHRFGGLGFMLDCKFCSFLGVKVSTGFHHSMLPSSIVFNAEIQTCWAISRSVHSSQFHVPLSLCIFPSVSLSLFPLPFFPSRLPRTTVSRTFDYSNVLRSWNQGYGIYADIP